MTIHTQIKEYIASQTEPKRADMTVLHKLMLQLIPNCKLWYLEGKDENGKVVSNPNIGYGSQTLKYADGKSKEFY